MSLRIRLAVFYILIMGIALGLVGFAVYNRVTKILVDQIDQALTQAARDIIRNAEINNGEYSLPPNLSINPDIVIQLWNPRGGLIASSQTFNPQSGLVFPLYSSGLEYEDLMFADVSMGGSHLRVLSVPVEFNQKRVGTLQAAASLEDVDDAINILLQNLFFIGVGALVLAILLAGIGTNRALAPLATMTDTAHQITSADDLSSRIPNSGSKSDEIGMLISSFNKTLGRMEAIFESQKRFVADVGHELRTPLTVMKGNVDLLRRMGGIDEESLAGIENEVERMTRLVEDLLILAQAESGKLPMLREEVELDTLLLEVFQHAKILAKNKVNLEIGDIDQALVCGDRDRLKQVLLNLVNNAVSYSPEGGKVELGIENEDNWTKTLVRDNGIGIAKDDLEHIFDRFYRGEKSRARSKNGNGFGLGLPIANWIVESHGGRIEIVSKVDEGSTFCVWLPSKVKECEEDDFS